MLAKLKSKMVMLLATLLCVCCAFAISENYLSQSVKAEETASISLNVESNNVSYSDSIYVLYAVNTEGFDRVKNEVKMLFWDEVKTNYVYGNHDYESKSRGVTKVNGKDCLVFYSKGISAKEMTADIYARAYVEVGGETYYSEVLKFSVLEYAQIMIASNKLTGNQRKLLEALLAYGSAAQENFGFETDRLAGDEYFSVTLKNGKLPDGFGFGRYKHGEKIKIKADKPPKGKKFLHWKDKNGKIVSEDEEFEIEIGDENEYEAVYEDLGEIVAQLQFTDEIGYGCDWGLTLPAQVAVTHGGETEILDVTWDESMFDAEQIGEQVIYGNFADEEIYDTYGIEENALQTTVTVLPYSFELLDDGYAITGYGGNEIDLVLPSSYKGIPVTQVYEWAFADNYNIKSVVIPNSVTYIGEGAFGICGNLKSVVIGNGVTEIGTYAFGECYGLTTVKFGHSVSVIGDNAFFCCNLLNEVEIPDSVTEIGSGAFEECLALTEIRIPNSVESIGEFAFLGSTSLARIEVEARNPAYKSINGDLYTKDGKTLLQYALGKEEHEFFIPDHVTTIADNAFAVAENLEEVFIPDSVTAIENGAFSSSSLKKATIPSSVKSMGSSLFNNCKSLVSAEILDGVKEVSGSMFSYCNSLTSVSLPNSIVEIKGSAFSYCESLESITIPSGVSAIGNYAFQFCRALRSVTIPNSVKEIGDYAFWSCTSLSSAYIGAGLSTLGSQAFVDCSSLEEIVVDEANANYKSVDGNLYTYDESVLVQYAVGKVDEEFIIPNSVVTVRERAFRRAKNLKSVIISDSVVTVGRSAFSECSNLIRVFVGSGVTTVETEAFRNCTALAEVINRSPYITVVKGSMKYGYIGYYALNVYNSGDEYTGSNIKEDNGFLISVDGDEYVLISYSGSQTDIIIPNYVTKIGDYAFRSSGITGITIPDSVLTIGDCAFYSCRNLQAVNMGNGVTQIGNNAFSFCQQLTDINLPEGLQTIGNSAFSSCIRLKSITLPDSVNYIGERAFSTCIRMTSIVIGRGLYFIGKDAFKFCYRLVEVVNNSGHITVEKGSDGYGYLGYYALEVINRDEGYESKLSNDNGYTVFDNGEDIILVNYDGEETELVIPEYITKINAYACYEILSLTSVQIGEGVREIGSKAFYYCDALIKIVISDSVEVICDQAFMGCLQVTTVILGNGVQSIGAGAFSLWTENTETVYYKGNAEDWASIIVAEDNGDLITADIYFYVENAEDLPSDGGNYWHYDQNGNPVAW